MSTKSSIEFVELCNDDYFASCHIYTECFDDSGDVYIESWMQGDAATYCETIKIRKDVWDEIVAKLKGGE